MTSPLSPWVLLRGQLAFLSGSGYDVCVASGPGDLLEATARREGVRWRQFAIERNIHLLRDLRSLLALVRLYRVERPSVSMVSTPKASLLAGLAAAVTRVPVRLYVVRGLRLETSRPAQRAVLWVMERVTMACATEVVFVSRSLRDRARRLRLVGRSGGTVLGQGASNGVDLSRFHPSADRAADARRKRRELGIPTDHFVFGFVGRVTPDKGYEELIRAFARITERMNKVTLLVVGGIDGDEIPKNVHAFASATPNIVQAGWLPDTSPMYQVMDALVLPTHREGFPNVCLEAGAAARPIITTMATGAIDAIVPGETGLIVPVADVDELTRAMTSLARDPDGAERMGQRGLEFVSRNFSNKIVWANLLDFISVRDPSHRLVEPAGRDLQP